MDDRQVAELLHHVTEWTKTMRDFTNEAERIRARADDWIKLSQRVENLERKIEGLKSGS